ncbi:hypothetical protein Q5P01_000913 [Channa striata]|uniref:Uncharacterized protein n=1 Tax=Channa striata TaxID=64152 RepID=A0AA88IG79_CHASR|nr:hypothetical protein Q5P01_000913 [Channa striata]
MAYGGGNITFSNHSEGTANGSAASVFDYCHSLYLHSRILVPLLHAVVTTVGLSINLYMMLVLFRDSTQALDRSLTRSDRYQGWIFGYAGCKAVKGLITERPAAPGFFTSTAHSYRMCPADDSSRPERILLRIYVVRHFCAVYQRRVAPVACSSSQDLLSARGSGAGRSLCWIATRSDPRALSSPSAPAAEPVAERFLEV